MEFVLGKYLHRDDNLPAYIEWREELGPVLIFKWVQFNLIKREGQSTYLGKHGLPSVIDIGSRKIEWYSTRYSNSISEPLSQELLEHTAKNISKYTLGRLTDITPFIRHY